MDASDSQQTPPPATRVAVFSARQHDRLHLERAARGRSVDLTFFDARLEPASASLAAGFDAVCLFVNDRVDSQAAAALARAGVRLIALRSAGFNHVDLEATATAGLAVARVPAYSPHAIAEHAVALLLALNRRIHRAHARVREGNFTLDGLCGFDLVGKTVGVVGTGQIGRVFARIMLGFGSRVVAYDPAPDPDLERAGVRYLAADALLEAADIVSLHCPLTAATRHFIDARALQRMKPGVMLINTGRGGLVDTRALIRGLKDGRIGHLGLDVYEEEEHLFARDLSNVAIQDDVFMRLLTFPNVLITAHQAFFTAEALTAIAATTIDNVVAFFAGTGTCHLVIPPSGAAGSIPASRAPGVDRRG